MTKSDRVARIAAKTEFSSARAAGVPDAVLSTISDARMRGESVSISGFGSFSVQSRPGRQGRNPRTGDTITIAASKVPSFKAATGLWRDATLEAPIRCGPSPRSPLERHARPRLTDNPRGGVDAGPA